MSAFAREPVRMLITTPEFFATPPKKLTVEEDANVNRTYFVAADKIVAVGELPQQ